MRCIDADTLEEILEKIPAADIKNMGGQAYVLVKLSQVFNVIDNQPTIEPERKKGKWIDTTQGDHYKCSCCGTRAAFWFNEENSSGWEKDMSEWLSDYCPNCGADMREDAEEAKKCDTCQHEKEPWFNRCADCSDYELWESKE